MAGAAVKIRSRRVDTTLQSCDEVVAWRAQARRLGTGRGAAVAISDITNRADAAHLLRRAGFGGDPGEITALTGRSRGSCVDAVMGFRSTDSIPLGPDIGVHAFVTRVRQWDS